jgi:hypothetical protein
MSRKILIAGIVVASLLLLGVAAPDLAPSIDWWVIGAGGGSVTTGSTTLSGTAGQAVVGRNTTGSTALCAGFWCSPSTGTTTVRRYYLPMVRRNS